MTGLEGKIILVTGGSDGFGKASAGLFTEQGSRVVIASRSMDKLKAAQKETGCADILCMDVTLPESWDNACSYIMQRYGRLDILVNNAGGGISIKDTVEQSVEDIDRIIMLNLNSVIYGSRVFGKLMKEQRDGTIINVSSVCAKEAWPQWSVYAAAKWGVLGFSKGLYVELQPYNVRVTCIIPAAGQTSFRINAGMPDDECKLKAEDVANVIIDICKLPKHVVIEETTVWGIDQIANPL